MQSYRNNSLALVGLSNGSLATVNLNNLSILFWLKDTQKDLELESISKIYITACESKFYCLHEHYITEWNLKFSAALTYLQINNPTSLIQFKDKIYIACMNSKLIILNEKAEHQLVSTSLRCIKALKQISESFIAVAGADGIVDILS